VGFFDSSWILACQYDPTHLDLRIRLGEMHDGATSADFDIIAVRTETEQPFNAGHV
jgi:hypothetical protein